ncbi:MAG: class I SAM-dependent methyltransferase [Chitinophagaceae bacterium]
MIGNSFVKYLKHQSFQPDFLSVFFNPFFFIRRSLYKHIRKYAPLLNGKLLDYGCGRKPYENLFNITEYVGVDIEQSGHDHQYSKVDVFFDGRQLPFEDETFDSLFCSEVLEHLFNPDESLSEMHRVLKKDAKLLITLPFSWNEHEIPYDYARYTSFGIRNLLERNGFKVIEIAKSGNFARVNWQMWILYIFDLFKKYKRTGYLLSLVFIAPLNILGVILLPLFPRDNSLFFNNIVIAQRLD